MRDHIRTKSTGILIISSKYSLSGAGVAQSVQWLRYGLDDRLSTLGRSKEFPSSPPRPHYLWATPSLLSNGYLGLLPLG